MSNNLPENDGELIEDFYENEDSSDQFDISAIGEAYANQKTYPSINPYTGQPDTSGVTPYTGQPDLSGITPINNDTVADQDRVVDTADRTPQQYTVDTSQNGGTPGSPIVNPTIVEEPPLPRTRIVTTTSYYDMEITDYSPAALASLQSQGYKAIAIYDDGTEAEVPWSEVHDLNPTAQYILTDIEEMTLANNQHFWTRTENPDGAGSGAFVTDDEQDAFLYSAQNNFADQGDPSETVEQIETFTSDGLTTRYDLYYEAASTDYSVKVNDYDVNSGITKNATNFVFDDAPDVDATVSVTYETPARPWHNLLLNSYGMGLRQGLTNLATFTKSAVTFFDGDGNQNSNINAYFGRDGSRIGKEDESHIQLDYHSLQLIDLEGNRYLHVSDLRDQDGKGPLISEICVAEFHFGADWADYTTSHPIYFENDVALVESVTVDGTVLNSSQYRVERPDSTTFPNTVQILCSIIPDLSTSVVQITYYSTGPLLKAFTFGNRLAGSFIGGYSASFGKDVTASGIYSHAEGLSAIASGDYSHAEGWGANSRGKYSHAEGHNTVASGYYSHVEGTSTTASAGSSHAEGYGTEASGDSSHAEGWETTASGPSSHAEGDSAEASGYDSHAEGYRTTASGTYSHVEGRSSTVSGEASHAEGYDTLASGNYSHAEGYYAIASGDGSHAEGWQTTASGDYSHAEGEDTKASGDSSHASGTGTKATAANQFVIGKYNATDANAAFIIGNGASDSSRSNIFWINNAGKLHTRGTGIIKYGVTNITSAPSSDVWFGGFEYKDDAGNRAATLELGHLTTGKTLRLKLSDGNGNVGVQSGFTINKSYGNTYSGEMIFNGDNGHLHVPGAIHANGGMYWPAPQNIACTATANYQEWSIDIGVDSTSYTGCYFQVWSSKNSKTILACHNDGMNVTIPNGPLECGSRITATNGAAGWPNGFVVRDTRMPLVHSFTTGTDSAGFFISPDATAGNFTGRMLVRELTSNNRGLLLETSRTVNDSRKYNSIHIGIDSSGNPKYSVTNPANFRSAIGAAASSDRRLKTNLTPLGEEAVDFINSLTAYQYDIGEDMWRRHEVGVIAQDVSAADPWHTKMAFQTEEDLDGLDDWEKMKDGSPTWKLDYIRLIPPLITTVQSQAKRIERLEKIIEQLSN